LRMRPRVDPRVEERGLRACEQPLVLLLRRRAQLLRLDARGIHLEDHVGVGADLLHHRDGRSEDHTSELQTRENLVCRLLLEKKKKHNKKLLTIKKKILPNSHQSKNQSANI